MELAQAIFFLLALPVFSIALLICANFLNDIIK